MKVICLKACVSRLGSDVRSLIEGRSYDLPDEMAKRLVDGGLVRREGKATPEKKPEKPTPAKRVAKKAAPKRRSPKKGAASSKKLDGAPENKEA